MCEVTRFQFAKALPYILDEIDDAVFIAIDTEFTGLYFADSLRSSLFDDGEARYQKLKENVRKFLPCQIGLSAYTQVRNTNEFITYSYNFNLFPQSFGPINKRFACEAASFEFLANHNYDFNKFVYEGVPYLNNAQEKILKEHLRRNHAGIERPNVDEDSLQECCSTVADWLINARDGDTLEVPGPACVSTYIVITELRLRFPTTWTTLRDDGQIIVELVGEETRRKLFEDTKDEEENRALNERLGFTLIFRKMVECKKTIVGHNCLMDLLFMYEYFHEPLPDTFTKFKENITALFPNIYDTKHIVNTIKRPWEESGLFGTTSLAGLFESLESEKGRFFVLSSPHIKLAEGFERYKTEHCPHEAGYDAYMCGKVFIRLAHIIALKEKSVHLHRPLGFYEYLTDLKRFKLRINLIRGNVHFVNLGGADPPSPRPQYLHVQPRKFNGTINAPMVAQMFSGYGSVDVRMRGAKSALVAVSNYREIRDILRNFRKHDKLFVTRYSMWKHSPIVRGFLWAGVFVSGGICVWALLGFPGPTRKN